MSPDILRSWLAWQRPLHTVALQCLARALAGHEPAALADPIHYACRFGEGLSGEALETRLLRVQARAGVELDHRFNDVFAFHHWWVFATADECVPVLAAEVELELARRERVVC